MYTTRESDRSARLVIVHSENVLLQTAPVLGAMWAVRATLCRILAAFDLHVILHVPQPAVILAAIWTFEGTRLFVEVAAPFP